MKAETMIVICNGLIGIDFFEVKFGGIYEEHCTHFVITIEDLYAHFIKTNAKYKLPSLAYHILADEIAMGFKKQVKTLNWFPDKQSYNNLEIEIEKFLRKLFEAIANQADLNELGYAPPEVMSIYSDTGISHEELTKIFNAPCD